MVLLLILPIIFFFVGCDQKPKTRHYTEVVIESPLAKAPMQSEPALSGKLAWSVPEGWHEEAGNAMRLATFHSNDNEKSIDVSIVSLPGGAGGLEANLKRWMGQIGMDVSDAELKTFIKNSPNKIFDFTQLQKDAPVSTNSMMAALLEIDGATVFVKMTGTIQSVNQHKSNFLKLVKSIHSNE
jgi:hypothetical protein